MHPALQRALHGTPDRGAATPPRRTRRIRLWDVPTRLFHWLLLLAVSIAIVTAQLGGKWMELHGRAGVGIGALLVFRLVWGVVGNRYARFASFLPTRASLSSYLRGDWQGLGHNPLGACSVLALLLLLLLQVGTGLFATDEIIFSGPWAASVSEAFSMGLTHWHHLLSNVLYVLIGLHVLAILFYYFRRRDNLVGPMLNGYKEVDDALVVPEEAAPGWPAVLLALALALAAALLFLNPASLL